MRNDQQSIHVRANGRWEGILASFGIPQPILNRRKHHPCPWCGGKDRFRFTDQNGTGAFLCGQCGKKSPVDVLMKAKGWDFATAVQEIERVMGAVKPTIRRDISDWLLKQKRELWNASQPIETGDFVDRYLRRRGIAMKRFPSALRKVAAMEHVDDGGVQTMHPGLVARVRAPSGEDVSLHRTYLSERGEKASVEGVRKVMAGTIPPGSAVRLYEATGEVLGIAEGLETALAASMLFRVPVWSALNSNLLEKWEVPVGIREVIIFGDNDLKYGGQAAALALAHRLAVKAGGPSVRIEIPSTSGTDWNDVLQQRCSTANKEGL